MERFLTGRSRAAQAVKAGGIGDGEAELLELVGGEWRGWHRGPGGRRAEVGRSFQGECLREGGPGKLEFGCIAAEAQEGWRRLAEAEQFEIEAQVGACDGGLMDFDGNNVCV